ncbi:hypothetical protein QQ045_001711 [Rhodiola kirilowii]
MFAGDFNFGVGLDVQVATSTHLSEVQSEIERVKEGPTGLDSYAHPSSSSHFSIDSIFNHHVAAAMWHVRAAKLGFDVYRGVKKGVGDVLSMGHDGRALAMALMMEEVQSGTENDVEGVQYGADNAVEGVQSGVENDVEEVQSGADNDVEGVQFRADNAVEGVQASGAENDVEEVQSGADNDVERVQFRADNAVEGVQAVTEK